MLKNKKGSLLDIVFIGIVVLFFGMTVLIGFKFMDELDDRIQSSDVTNNARARAASSQLRGDYPGVINHTFLFFTVGLAIGALMLAAMVRVHPIFIPLFLIALVFVIFFAGLFSNIYQEIANEPSMTALADELTFIGTILNTLPLIVGIFGTILMIVMYKLRSYAE